MSSSKPRVQATRSVCLPTRSCRTRSGICSNARSGDHLTRYGRYYASFRYQAQSWNKPRHVVAKIEWYPGELYPSVGFIVTDLVRSAEGIVAFYNRRGTCEQYINPDSPDGLARQDRRPRKRWRNCRFLLS